MAESTGKTTGVEKGIIDRDSEMAKDRIIKGYAGGTKGGVDLANRTIDGIASTINLDRDDEVILPKAVTKTMGKFLGGNSPFLDAHQHRGPGPTQVGWVMEMRQRGERISCKFRFVEDDPGTPPERWWKLARDPKGKGIAFSIGFIPIRWVYGSAVDLVREFPELKKPLHQAGLKDEDKIRVYTEIELLEISAVPVPSNREAMQLLAAKLFAGDDEKELATITADIAKAVVAELGENLKSQIETCMADVVADLRDKVAQVIELMELSSDPFGQETLPASHSNANSNVGNDNVGQKAPAGGDDPNRSDDSDGAKAAGEKSLAKLRGAADALRESSKYR